MQTDTLQGFKSFYNHHHKQYTILAKKKYVSIMIIMDHWICRARISLTPFPIKQRSNILNWFDEHHMNIIDSCCHSVKVDNNVYRPSTYLYRYILWTFNASYASVTLTFLLIYVVVNLVFGCLLYVAGSHEPYCITASGEHFGAHPQTKFIDAYSLSWTTFTTVVRF